MLHVHIACCAPELSCIFSAEKEELKLPNLPSLQHGGTKMETCMKRACTFFSGGASVLTSLALPHVAMLCMYMDAWLRHAYCPDCLAEDGLLVQGLPQCAEPVPGAQHI